MPVTTFNHKVKKHQDSKFVFRQQQQKLLLQTQLPRGRRSSSSSPIATPRRHADFYAKAAAADHPVDADDSNSLLKDLARRWAADGVRIPISSAPKPVASPAAQPIRILVKVVDASLTHAPQRIAVRTDTNAITDNVTAPKMAASVDGITQSVFHDLSTESLVTHRLTYSCSDVAATTVGDHAILGAAALSPLALPPTHLDPDDVLSHVPQLDEDNNNDDDNEPHLAATPPLTATTTGPLIDVPITDSDSDEEIRSPSLAMRREADALHEIEMQELMALAHEHDLMVVLLGDEGSHVHRNAHEHLDSVEVVVEERDVGADTTSDVAFVGDVDWEML